ncbi:MAG: hypothetical protein ACPG6P_12830, partial [Akkermansiaceae bacterium]
MPKHHDYDALPTDARAPSFRQEMRVVIAVVLFVLVLEGIARYIAPTLDYDRENIHEFPQVIHDLEEQAESSGRPRIVFFGNSLMMHGLDQEIVKTQLGETKIESAKITPVGTAMLDWVYLYERYFETEGSHPDVLVVGFVAHHIHDQEGIKLRRLARHFVRKQDLMDLWDFEKMGLHQMSQSVLCNISALEGDQPEHQLGILHTMVADYQNGVNRNNKLVAAANKRKAEARAARAAQSASPEKKDADEKKETYRRLTRFIEQCQEHGVELWFVPMPQPEVWDFNPAAESLMKSYGAKVLD